MNQIRLSVIRLIAELTEFDAEISFEMCLYDDIGIDSLSIVDLITQVEKEFQISFLDSETKEVKTVNDLLSKIESKLQ